MVVDIPDTVTCTNFGDHPLRGFWVAGGQISPSPIDFHRRPYNTLALPCERVMVLDKSGAPHVIQSFTKYVFKFPQQLFSFLLLRMRQRLMKFCQYGC